MCIFRGGIKLFIERIDEKRLMIVLQEDDMNSLDLTYEAISWKNHRFKLLVAKLLALAKFKTGFSVDDCKLSIETIPQGAGCMIIFTLFPKLKPETISPDNAPVSSPKEANINPYIYKFNSGKDLLDVCEQLGKINRSNIGSNSVFRLGEKYYMIIYPNDAALPKNISVILSEYGQQVRFSKVYEAHLYESGKVIHKKNAISYIEKCLK